MPTNSKDFSTKNGIDVNNSFITNSDVYLDTDKYVSMFSSDGFNYALTVEDDGSLTTQEFGPALAVATSSSQALSYSINGINWYAGTMIDSSSWGPISWGNDRFMSIAGGLSNKVSYSLDGVSWTASTLAHSAYNSDLAYDGVGTWVVVGSWTSNSASYSLNNGVSWQISGLYNENAYRVVAYGSGKWIALGNYSTHRYSTDGITWTAVSIRYSTSYTDLIYGNGAFISLANTDGNGAGFIGRSADGLSWTSVNLPEVASWTSLASIPGTYIAAQNGPNVATSTNGTTWTIRSMPSSQNWRVTSSSNKFIAVAYNSNVFATSTDGITWTIGTMSSTNNWSSVAAKR